MPFLRDLKIRNAVAAAVDFVFLVTDAVAVVVVATTNAFLLLFERIIEKVRRPTMSDI